MIYINLSICKREPCTIYIKYNIIAMKIDLKKLDK